ncbi:MAG: sugar ABC transporter permease [Rhodospirillaceae bacterium]|nr:sugar ABC transporter permease [Rhodospirillaceae bacterium]
MTKSANGTAQRRIRYSAAARRKGSRRQVNTLPLVSPSVIVLFLWMIVPLGMTIYFSLIRYNLQNPFLTGFAGIENYEYLLTDPALWTAMWNTLILVGSVLVITVVCGTLLAVLFDAEFYGRGIARLLVIAPFFVMPTVSALVWKNLLMHPINGVFSSLLRGIGLEPIDWFADAPLLSIIIIVSWQWIPFAFLILLTAIQSLDNEQKEAARMDGAGPVSMFFFIILPHLSRALSVVIMIEMIFLLTIFAEIFVTTAGGPGLATTNLPFLIYARALLDSDVGGASAGGIIAVVLANIVAIFLVRAVARNLDQ